MEGSPHKRPLFQEPRRHKVSKRKEKLVGAAKLKQLMGAALPRRRLPFNDTQIPAYQRGRLDKSNWALYRRCTNYTPKDVDDKRKSTDRTDVGNAAFRAEDSCI
jgi:hypothetical protein